MFETLVTQRFNELYSHRQLNCDWGGYKLITLKKMLKNDNSSDD